MLIAKEKKKSNIAEYILYMWQVEDMLRAFNLNMEEVDKNVVSHYTLPDDLKREVYEWYDNIIEIMKRERVEERGHIQALRNTVDEMTELHFFLLYKEGDPQYRRLVTEAAKDFVDYRKRSGVGDEISDVELALEGLYGVLMLRLRGDEISEDTSRAMERFGRVMAYLAVKFKEKEEREKRESD